MDRDSILDSSETEKFLRGISLFNAGEFFRAHEVWEEIWLAASGRRKVFLQGLIQLAAALHHYSRQNIAGAQSLLRASLNKLEKFPEHFGGIRLSALRQQLQKWLNKIVEVGIASDLDIPHIEFAEKSEDAEKPRKPRAATTDRQSAGPSSPYARSRKKRNT